MNEQATPVLIIGGGLTGLAASVFLAWHGVASVLVERHAGLSAHPKARAINPRTTEVFRSVGLEDEVIDSRSPIADNTDLLHVVTLAGAERVRLPRPESEAVGRLSPSGWALIDQNRLEPILLERSVRAGGEVHYNTEVLALSQDDDGVTVVVRDRGSGEERRVRARYVIAADGNNSPTRTRLGIEQHGPGTLTNLVSFFFRAELASAIRGRRIIAAYVNNEHLRGTFMPMDNDRRWVFNVSYDPRREDPKDFDERWCVEMVRRGVGIDDLDVMVETTDLLPWEIAARVAATFRHGRVLLAGDAAHVMPPTGAFGASTGVQDAHNLAWKLALVVKGLAAPELLDSYDAERRPIAELMMTQSMLRFDIREGRAFEDVADRMLDELTMSFGYRYPTGALLPETGEDPPLVDDPRRPSVQPGTRAPHVELERDTGKVSTVDLFGREFVLLAGGGGQAWPAAGRRVSDALDVPVRVYLVGPDGDLRDPNGAFAGAYGIVDRGAVLVRPDGFIAWRATDDDSAHRLVDLVAGLLSRTSALVGPSAGGIGN